MRPRARRPASVPPAMSTCAMIQPPKMSPFWLASAGIGMTRSAGCRSAGSASVTTSARDSSLLPTWRSASALGRRLIAARARGALSLDDLRVESRAHLDSDQPQGPRLGHTYVRDEAARRLRFDSLISTRLSVIDHNWNHAEELEATIPGLNLAFRPGRNRPRNLRAERHRYPGTSGSEHSRGNDCNLPGTRVHLIASADTLAQRMVPMPTKYQSSWSLALTKPVAPGTLVNASR